MKRTHPSMYGHTRPWYGKARIGVPRDPIVATVDLHMDSASPNATSGSLTELECKVVAGGFGDRLVPLIRFPLASVANKIIKHAYVQFTTAAGGSGSPEITHTFVLKPEWDSTATWNSLKTGTTWVSTGGLAGASKHATGEDDDMQNTPYAGLWTPTPSTDETLLTGDIAGLVNAALGLGLANFDYRPTNSSPITSSLKFHSADSGTDAYKPRLLLTTAGP